MSEAEVSVKPRFIRRAVTLREVPGTGWMWVEQGREYASLVSAIRAVNRDAKRIATGDVVLTSLVTYEPCTPVGSVIVKALTSA